jgi:NADH-quinone oxidoreductase subunit H
MSLGWKIMLPLALAYIIIIAGVILVLETAGIGRGAMYSSIMGVVNIIVVMIVFTILDHGRIISPAYGRLESVRLARLRAMSARSPLATGVSRS